MAMRCFSIFLLCLLLGSPAISAQEMWASLPDSLGEVLHADSLLPDIPVDSIGQNIEASRSRLEALEDSLGMKLQLPDSLSPERAARPLLDKVDSLRGGAEALEDSLKNLVQVPDSLKKYLPKEVGFLEERPVTELGEKEMKDIKSIGGEKIGKPQHLEGMDNLSDIDLGIGEMPSLEDVPQINEIGKLSEQADRIKQEWKLENLEGKAEKEAGQLKAIRAMEEQKGSLNEHTALLEQHGEQDYYKEKVKKVAKDHFAGHTEKLQAAQEKLAEIKKDYPEGLSSIKDLPKRRPNRMKGKPFKERLVLGMTLQVHQDKTPNLDLSPFAAYRWTERLSFGLGGNYRVMTKDRFKGLTRMDEVYGARAFSEFNLYKGIFVHAGYEMMRAPRKEPLSFNGKAEDVGNTWVDGLLIGAGKDYRIARYVKGNMQVLYNFLDEVNSPYRNKVMVRLGFSFQLKDRIKKPVVRSQDREKLKDRAVDKGKGFLRK